MATKTELRQRIKALRDAMTSQQVAEKSAGIEARVLDLAQIKQARSVFVYVSVGNEVQTHGLIEHLLQRGKVVAAPLVVRPGVMEPHQIDSLDDLAPGRFNIPEPTTGRRYDAAIDVCIVPGVAFTEQGDRLGKSGGYFDRFLAVLSSTVSIGLCYEAQLIEALPTDADDRPVQIIVTDSRVIRA